MPEKRVILVTASTRGIGKVIAMRFAEEGAVIALNYLSNKSAADEACAEIQRLRTLENHKFCLSFPKYFLIASPCLYN
ncbi:MAG: SDR family NAD(P)-dependent oxidoreductase [bacterium]